MNGQVVRCIFVGWAFVVMGCAAPPELVEEKRTVTSKYELEVDLPSQLGGGRHGTRRATSEAPRVRRPLGLTLSSTRRPAANGALRPRRFGIDFGFGGPPASADLSRHAPSTGNQGETSSCTTWTTGYSMMGWWANRRGLSGAPYAPMYLYSQMVNGACQTGAQISDPLELLLRQGIPSATRYQPMQQNLDCRLFDVDASTERDAAQHRITSYRGLDTDDVATWIMTEIGDGRPVALGMQMYNNFMNADADHVFVDVPPAGEQTLGGHAIAAFAYDQNGVWILNSWGTEWGRNGWAQLSWDFIVGSNGGMYNLNDAQVIDDVVVGGR